MKDIMSWQCFTKEDGSIDADKGSVITVYAKTAEGQPKVSNLTRRETATMLGAFKLTSDFLQVVREREAAEAFQDVSRV